MVLVQQPALANFGPLATLCSQRVEKVKLVYSMWSDGSRM